MGLGVDHGGEEADEEVKEVDPEAVGDDVEALDEVDAEGVDGGDGEGADPAPRGVRGGAVQVVLERPRGIGPPLGRRRRGARRAGVGRAVHGKSWTEAGRGGGGGESFPSLPLLLLMPRTRTMPMRCGSVFPSLPSLSLISSYYLSLWTTLLAEPTTTGLPFGPRSSFGLLHIMEKYIEGPSTYHQDKKRPQTIKPDILHPSPH